MSSPFLINPRSSPELRSLYEIITLPHQTHLEDYFLGVMAILAEYFPIKYSALFLQDGQRQVLRIEALYGAEKGNHPLTCSSQQGTMGKALESRQPRVIQNLSQEPLYEEMLKWQKRSEKIQPPILCIPLVMDEISIGLINMNSLYGPRDKFIEDFQFLSVLSAILSPVIKHYQQKKNQWMTKDHGAIARSQRLNEILEQKLSDVLMRIDPYTETKAKMGIFDDMVRLVEKILIQSALERMDHVQIKAAQLLGINRNTLHKKMKELKIKPR
ncbi:MAG: GAF domain-containing protein [Syntrophaceae bacterium]|nr:GAF domain-containing protein [Syntrophaceae bacterium]